MERHNNAIIIYHLLFITMPCCILNIRQKITVLTNFYIGANCLLNLLNCSFQKEGNALAFGRSLTYKFAQVAFWAIYSDFLDDEYELSYIKGIINRNLTWWQSQNIIDSNGFLNIGYSYHNQFMTEYYNAKGSSYWCLKLFIILINKSDRFSKSLHLNSIQRNAKN